MFPQLDFMPQESYYFLLFLYKVFANSFSSSHKELEFIIWNTSLLFTFLYYFMSIKNFSNLDFKHHM